MDTPVPDGSDGEAAGSEGILQQVEDYLKAYDAWENDLATEEDYIIVQCLQQAVRAARQKGYSEEFLLQVLRSLFQTPPNA